MPTYTFRYNEVSMNQVWFEADNEEHANFLMQQVQDDEISFSDLPNRYERNRGIDMDYSVSYIEKDSVD